MNIQETILFGRYRILSELGRGSGTTVYLARHQKLGGYRAVKRILKDPESAWKIREADILNHLNHPQIPHIYDVEEDEEFFYMVEEYAEGESLEALMLQSSFITLDFICYIITETANILDYMHHLKPFPMLYQDLKPEHIIVGKNSVKLVDFGIADFLSKTGNKFQNYGTPRFCAPEKLSDAKVGIYTDIYSIGKLLEELIRAEGNHKSRCLMQIAKKAADPDRSARYASAGDFLSAVKEQMQSKKISIYQGHLLKKIVAAGSQPHIGTTHLSFSLTEYFNQNNLPAVYREHNSSDDMRTAARQGSFVEEGGLYRRKNFLGMPAYGQGVEVNIPYNAIEIIDYGSDIAGAVSEGADMFLLVVGSREWETECANAAYETAKHKPGLVLISNYGNKSRARQYAKKYGRRVYCFPLDKDPFYMTKEKERMFDGLLEKERTVTKKYWNCRKYPRQWRNALSRGIGKLCGKRAK